MAVNTISFDDIWEDVLLRHKTSPFLLPKSEKAIKAVLIDGVSKYNMTIKDYDTPILDCDAVKEEIINLDDKYENKELLIYCIRYKIAEGNLNLFRDKWNGDLKGQISTKFYKDSLRGKESEVEEIENKIYHIRSEYYDNSIEQ